MPRKKGNTTRQPAEIERDRRRIAQMYLQGMLQSEIGEELELSQPTISNELKLIQKEWFAERINDVHERKMLELAKVDNLELEYWRAWRRSQRNEETRKEVDTPRGFVSSFQEKGQVGDPSFLQGVQWCINKRCELLGLDAPGRNINLNLDKLSFEQLQRLAQGEDIVSVLAG